MTAYYISGPMRGKPDYNHAQFAEVEKALVDSLHDVGENSSVVINPSKNFGGAVDLEPSEYLNLDLKQVLSADFIVLLPGWRESEGARREVELAVWTGKRFMEAIFIGSPVNEGWIFNQADISAPSQNPSPRADVLDEARALITGDRSSAYGPPTQDFARTAGMATEFGFRVVPYEGAEPQPLKAYHVALFMMMLKISRLAWTATRRDSWVDAAGYSGCGYECSLSED
jgi:hypothetical protein